MLRSDLCDFNDAYIVVKGDITVGAPNSAKRNKAMAIKNNPPFFNCISKINGLKIDNAENLDVVMPMYNLLEYSKNYKKTTGSLWNYYRDEPSNPVSSDSESFKYETSITENTYHVAKKITDDYGNEVDNPKYDANKVGKNETEVVIPLKHLCNFCKHLTNYLRSGIDFNLIKKFVLADMTTKDAEGKNPANVAPVVLTFEITDKKLDVPVITLSKENDIKLLEQLKTGFKRTIKWNKYRSQMTIQPKNNNLNYLINPTFTNINRLFVLPITRTDTRDYRNVFSNYYVPDVEIKDLNVLID